MDSNPIVAVNPTLLLKSANILVELPEKLVTAEKPSRRRFKTFCVDPKKTWPIDVIQYLDKKKAAPSIKTTAQPIESTLNTASTLSTTENEFNSDRNGLDEPQTERNEYITTTGRSFCPCLKTAEVVMNKEDIRSYKIHNADVCHVDTVEFKTVKGKTFCADPKKTWVKDAMESLDKKKAAPGIKTTAQPIGSTLNTASTLSTTEDSAENESDELQTELNEYSTTTGRSFCPCLKTAEVVMNKEDIKSYKIHNADVCHVDTVEFKTVKGKTFCADPKKVLGERSYGVSAHKEGSAKN
ncbi:uncharacterized protein isoform X2 [Danio rerio]|uniref:Uncharacterized protein isoform X2 n=1 Tax=Danio rerio TaxID=7955 RepID=A0AC58IT13_DANRE